MGENHFAALPVALYGFVMLMAAVSYTILVRTLLARHGQDSVLARAMGSDLKGRLSLAAYVLAILVSTGNRWVSCAIYVAVALVWLVPDLRIERALAEKRE